MNKPKRPDPSVPDPMSVAEKIGSQVDEMITQAAEKLSQAGDQAHQDTEALKEYLINMTPDEQAVLENLLGR